MRSYEDALKLLHAQSNEIAKLRRTRNDYLNSDLNAADKAEKVDKLDDQLKQLAKERIDVLHELVMYPPHHLQYEPMLKDFSHATPCSKSVFIMTKYPDGANVALDAELQAVIDTVKKAVTDSGYYPHVAAEKKLHPNLWENVECQMLACARGIAIVEDKFNPKLNPNVAMEWGWMRAMRKPVLYLVEKAVTVVPADVVGLIKSRFDWQNAKVDIPPLVAEELKK